jgi:hypothetical protein
MSAFTPIRAGEAPDPIPHGARAGQWARSLAFTPERCRQIVDARHAADVAAGRERPSVDKLGEIAAAMWLIAGGGR